MNQEYTSTQFSRFEQPPRHRTRIQGRILLPFWKGLSYVCAAVAPLLERSLSDTSLPMKISWTSHRFLAGWDYFEISWFKMLRLVKYLYSLHWRLMWWSRIEYAFSSPAETFPFHRMDMSLERFMVGVGMECGAGSSSVCHGLGLVDTNEMIFLSKLV